MLALTDTQKNLLKQIAELEFVTREQISAYCNLNLSVISSRYIQPLIQNKCIEKIFPNKPLIYKVTWRGSKISKTPLNRRNITANIIHSILLRNKVLLKLKQNSNSSIVPTQSLKQMGYRLAANEFVLTQDHKNILLIIDTGSLPENKVVTSLKRRHAPSNNMWVGLIDAVWIVSVDEEYIHKVKQVVESLLQLDIYKSLDFKLLVTESVL